MNKATKITLSIVVAVLIVLGGYNLYQRSQVLNINEPIKIGASLPMSGPAAIFGEWQLTGMRMAVDEINEQGGVKGRKIELIVEDDKGLPGEAQSTFMKLSNMDKVDYVVGGTTATIPVGGSVIKDKIIFLPAFAPESIEQNKNIFSLLPSVEKEMKVLASYIYGLGLKDASIMYVNNDLGVTAKNKFQVEFSNLGGKISSIEAFKVTDTDFRTQITKIKEANSPSLVVIMSAGGLGNIIKQANELKLDTQYFGQTITESSVFVSVAGKFAEGMIYTYPFKLDDLQQSFLQKYNAKNGKNPEMFATASYDTVYAIAELVKKCGVKCEVDDVSKLDFVGAGGRINFGEDNDKISQIYVKMVKDGKFVFIK